MSKADAETIKLLLWIILYKINTDPSTKAIAIIGVLIYAIKAIFATVMDE